LKVAEVTQIVGLVFFHGTRYELILANNWLGYILGDFFKNSSSHPACEP
jgi:hypothetical protein